MALLFVSTSMFVLKVAQSYRHLQKQNVGASVNLQSNLQVDPPALTVCKPEHSVYNPKKLGSYDGFYFGMEYNVKVKPFLIMEKKYPNFLV